MLTAKENLLETLKPGGHPDRFVNQYQPYVPVMNDPVFRFTRGNRVKGSVTRDVFGTEIVWPEDQFAAMPHVTAENKVCPDVTEWKKYVRIPDLRANCTDWKDAKEKASTVDRKEHLVLGFMGTGLFEELHFLMGFEDTLMNLLMEPEDMAELASAVAEYRFTYAQLLCENLKPDLILSHDDWGAKNSMFFSPEIWREIFKPHYKKMYDMIHSYGILVMHHADSFLEPIVTEMPEISVDIWQGVLPQNDIVSMGKELQGKMGLMGGIDAALVDREDATEEQIRTVVHEACAKYRNVPGFIPSLTYGLSGSIFPHVDPIIADEIDRCSKEMF